VILKEWKPVLRRDKHGMRLRRKITPKK